ncbi:NAD(P)H-dependent glycerol-3-phosphate dehydrogenase [Donghicola eburneus]|uniref:Glycerol-3-phosphate dehydrogenase [NAD(P)+] n=1 Tax=Donghicola eburneus TaxID=393278 RepID=A0A1M4N3L0_9RHOB|nr:NAD(P)H-dependent glycerol-3-phosphate dehydrogenase [Donghicola eburneus]SCM69421.1 Glycerol-3-phosphate dehydrogenase [NAD(P)+] [Donghicola eburneus]SFQ46556.1 glycerol-3-phosphate dehydrogenase (NAD(P)+) [Donghicola eburneus]
MSVSVLGAGAFGTALAITLAERGVTLWARDPDAATAMQKTRENATRLKGIHLPEGLTVTSDLTTACAADTILMAVPMQSTAAFVTENADLLRGKKLVACSKGVDLTSLRGPTAILAEVTRAPAIITGPSFAIDIARGLPTALTLACKNPILGEELQETLSSATIRLYRSTDPVGAELGGALKNVIAIAAGAVMGAGLGESARAALITRGFAEMMRIAGPLGAIPETLMGLSGFGDLTLTCTSPTSRNYAYGFALGQGADYDPTITVEGAATARAVARLARDKDIEMPITSVVAALVEGRLDVSQGMQTLLSRPLKEEI